MRRVDYEFIAICILSMISFIFDYLALAYHIAFPFGIIFVSFAYPFELVLMFLFTDLFYIGFGKKGIQIAFAILPVVLVAELIAQMWVASAGTFVVPPLFLMYVIVTDLVLLLSPLAAYYTLYVRRA